jgi:hypothetical protein
MRRRTDPATQLTELAMLLAVEVRHRRKQLGAADDDRAEPVKAIASEILSQLGMPSLAEPLGKLRRRIAARRRARNGKPAATGTDFT